MVDKPEYPVVDFEQTRRRRLLDAGFVGMDKIPELDVLCKDAKEHFGTEVAAITLLTNELQVLKGKAGIEAEQTPRELAFCNYTILEDAVFIVLDTLNDRRFRAHPFTTGYPFIRFYAGAPLTYLTDIRIGAFCLFDSRPRQNFTRGDQAELVDFADRAVQILVSRLGKPT